MEYVVPILLTAVPETFIFLLFSVLLLGYNLRSRLNRIFWITALYAPIFYIIQNSTALTLELKFFVLFLSYLLLLRLFLLKSLKEVLLVSLFSFFAQVVAKSIGYSVMVGILNIPGEQINSHLILQVILSWSYLTILLLFISFYYKKKLFFTHLHLAVNDQRYKYLYMIISLMFLLIITVSIFNIAILTNNTMLLRVNNIPLLGLISTVVFILFLLLFIHFIKLAENQVTHQSEEVYIENIENLLLAVRAQRHDFLNHLQVIYSLSKANRINDIKQYMDDLLEDAKEINTYLKINHPALGALLRAKEAFASAHHIRFEVNVPSAIQSTSMRPFELVKVVGNLIDNAFEEEEAVPKEKRFVRLVINSEGNDLIITVFNANSYIDEESVAKIFHAGFTTKRNHTGIGLAVSKKLLEKYNGNLEVFSEREQGTTFKVTIPLKW